MVDLATLALKIDSSEVGTGVRELDKLTSAGDRAEKEAKQLSRATSDLSTEQKILNSTTMRTAAAIRGVTVSAGQQRAGMQQLSFQIGDVAQQFALGTKPMTIFAQQGGQVIQALQMMSGSTKGFLGFLGGPWGAIITAAAVVLSPLIAKLFETGEAAEDAAEKLQKLNTIGGVSNLQKMALDKRAELNVAKDELDRIQQMVGRMPAGGGRQNTSLTRLLDAARSKVSGLSTELTQAESKVGIYAGRLNEAGIAVQKAGGATARASTAIRQSGTSAVAASEQWSEYTSELMRVYDVASRIRDSWTGKLLFDPGDITKDIDLTSGVKAVDEALDIGMKDAAETFRDHGIDAAYDIADALNGGVGKVLKQLIGFAEGLQTGNFQGVGGKLGGYLTLLNQTDKGKEFLDGFGSKLDNIFGGTGKFTKALKGATAGAATGEMVAGLGKALGLKMSTTGSQVGGAIGSFLPIPGGDIIGSIIGGLIGGAFKKTKKGVSTIGFVDGELGITSTTGNSRTRKEASISGATGIIDALSEIANQLGGDLGGTISTSIGIRKKSYKVDTTGQGRTKGAGVLDFGQDEAGAIKAAIQDAIRDGVITGLRAGTQALLKGGADIERQLSKALSFEGVFKELKQRTDPVAYAMEQLGTEMDGLKKIFAEAGASAAEYADLEKLFALKREDALKQQADDARSLLNERRTIEARILELQGNSTGALAIQRQLELEALDASLRPLQQTVYALEDMASAAETAAAAAEKFAGYRDKLRSFRDDLAGGDLAGGNAYRMAQVQFIKMSALANAGDESGLAGLEGAGREFIDASRGRSTFAQYQRDIAAVIAAADRAASVAEGRMTQEQAIVSINTQAAQISTGVQDVRGVIINLTDGQSSLTAKVEQLRAEMQASSIAIAQNTSEVARIFRRADRGDAIAITADADTPVPVSAA